MRGAYVTDFHHDLCSMFFSKPGVEVADDRADAGDRLAVEVDDEAKDAVRRGVVRPEVDAQDVLERGASRGRPRGSSARAAGCACPRRCAWTETMADISPRPRSARARRRAGSPCAAGCPSQSSGMRMRTRFACPSKRMPIMSQASRSNQSAAGQTRRTLAIDSPSSSQTCTRSRSGSSPTRSRWYETEKRFGFAVGNAREPLRSGLVEVAPAAVPM